ncbi:MAG TPA: OmpA family protein [Gemmatimonadaceae bacterium]|jgi:outer membrane protein OmpA-like peptidoglycan-associated protein
MIPPRARQRVARTTWAWGPLFALSALIEPVSAQGASQVPLVTGLTIVSALHYPEGDRENIVMVTNASSEGVRYAWKYKQQGTSKTNLPDRAELKRFVRASDLAGAPRLDAVFPSNAPEESPGFTAFSISRAAYQKLLAAKQMPYTITTIEGAGGFGKLGDVFASRMTMRGTLSLPSPQPEPIPVLLNGARVSLPALHLKGSFALGAEKEQLDMWVLADSTHPLIIRVIDGTDVLQTVRIDLPGGELKMENQLATVCRAEIPGIYFAFNSAELDPASDPALSEMSKLLAKHADWTFAIEGHTDNIGGDASNQTLSEQRAEAVRGALVGRYHIAAGRLHSAGFGAKRPREPNTTIEGRARNRRVELVRPCAK